MAYKIPDFLSFDGASVFSLCIDIAAHCLFAKDDLGIPLPKTNSTSTGKSVFSERCNSGVDNNAFDNSKPPILKYSRITPPVTSIMLRGSALTRPWIVDHISAELDTGVRNGNCHAPGQVTPSCQVDHEAKLKLFVVTINAVLEGIVPESVEAKMVFASYGAVVYYETSPAAFRGFLPEALASKGLYKVTPVLKVVPAVGLEDA
ncbi:hypothetical protein MMC17_004643 [Xylographa soralifera]|nr:hypothetical protein [Xylographa soralifera]